MAHTGENEYLLQKNTPVADSFYRSPHLYLQIRVYRGGDAKDFFEKKSSALPKNFEKGQV